MKISFISFLSLNLVVVMILLCFVISAHSERGGGGKTYIPSVRIFVGFPTEVRLIKKNIIPCRPPDIWRISAGRSRGFVLCFMVIGDQTYLSHIMLLGGDFAF